MGLDTTHDCWHGAYSSFARWRNEIAKIAGYQMENLGDQARPVYLLDWGHLTMDNLMGDWPAMPTNHYGEPEPLLILLAHSDCEGVILSQYCTPLADRLESLVPLLPEGEGGGHIGDWRDKTLQFVAGLRTAAAAGEDVEFF